MRRLRAWFVRLGGLFNDLFNKGRSDREFAAEMDSHLQMHIDDNLRSGMTADEARRHALIKLGGITQTKEIYGERRGIPAVETLLQDLRFAVRMLLKNPGFTVVAVLILALGIGANTAMFSVVRAVLLKPLAYSDPDRIVTLASFWKADSGKGQVSAPDYHDWHDQSTAFEAMAYYGAWDTAVTAGTATGATAEYAHAAQIGPDFFRVFGVTPFVGREFSAEEAKRGGSGAAILSYAYAAQHFGDEANALGKRVQMAGKTLDIVGVMPPGFRFPEKTDIWYPTNTIVPDTESRGAHNYRVIARLRDGVRLEQAQAQMVAIGARLEEKYPDSNKGKSVAVTQLRDEMVSEFRLTLYVMLAAVGVVLLIACANLANMLLAKAVARTREMAVRAAVGAGRGRIVRQLITESILLALIAGTAGLALAFWGCRTLVALAPGDVPRLAETGIDGNVLLFTLAISMVASLLFGLAPALQVLRVDLNSALKQSVQRDRRRESCGPHAPSAGGGGNCVVGDLGGGRWIADQEFCRVAKCRAGISAGARAGRRNQRARLGSRERAACDTILQTIAGGGARASRRTRCGRNHGAAGPHGIGRQLLDRPIARSAERQCAASSVFCRVTGNVRHSRDSAATRQRFQ